MNILFFLTPKSEVAYISEEDTLRQALEKMEYHKYSAIPIISRTGRYIGRRRYGRPDRKSVKPEFCACIR